MKVALQLREFDTGALLGEFSLRRELSVKADLDLVVGHLEDEGAFEEAMTHKYKEKIEQLTLKEGEKEQFSAGKQVSVLGNDFTMNANGHHVLVPVSLPATILGSNKNRLVIDTPQPTVMGLCGGPVLELDENGEPTDLVVGMVEGRIQEPTNKEGGEENGTGKAQQFAKVLAGRTVLIASEAISEFIATTVEEKLQTASELQNGMETKAKIPMPDMISQQIEMLDPGEQKIPDKLEYWDPNKNRTDSEVDF